jgi:CheY-like chemotaxis protein
MNCPRCKSPIGRLANPDAIVTCPGCGSRLMTRSAALRSQGGSPQPAAPAQNPSAAAPAPIQQTAVKVGVRQTTIAGKSTGASVRTGGRKSQPAAPAVTLEMLLAEIQAVRDGQQLILDALGNLRREQVAPAGGAAADAPDEAGATTLSPIRSAARKSVVLVDDDPRTCQAAVAELEQAEIPVRAFADANKALSAIAEDKPDVLHPRARVGGEPAGSLVNMIKATMEWVDIPIVLWTRETVSNQKEARQIHGADEVVSKSAGAAALVARVITVFRR